MYKKKTIKLGQIYNVPCNAKTDARHVREVNTINSIFLNCIGQNVSQKNMRTRFNLSDFCHSTALCCSSRKLHSDCSLAAPCPSWRFYYDERNQELPATPRTANIQVMRDSPDHMHPNER